MKPVEKINKKLKLSGGMFVNKKNGQVLKAVLAVGIIAWAIGMAQINTKAASVDEMYRNAYNATVNAQTENTQKAINVARTAIESLRNTDASFAVGEFSKQVDKVQHPFLVKIVDSINAAQQSGKQLDVNAARETIDPELPQVWKNSYSSALDTIEQTIINKLVDTFTQAISTGSEEDKAKVNDVIAELKLSTDPTVLQWVDAYTAPMLGVWSDNSINEIKNIVNNINDNISDYTPILLSNENDENITAAVIDSNKKIKMITALSEGMDSFFYDGDELVFIGRLNLGEDTAITDEIYMKDNKLVKWIITEGTGAAEATDTTEAVKGELKSIKVYDSSNLPEELQTKLASYIHTAKDLYTQTEAKVNN